MFIGNNDLPTTAISCCCSSVTESCLTLCDPMDCSTPGFPVLHHLPELAQTHVCWVGDAIQPSHPLSSPSPSFNLSQHRGLFQWVGSLLQMVKVLELQHQFFQWMFEVDFFEDWLVGSPCSPRDSQESSPTPQFKSINTLVLSFLYGPALTSIHDYWKTIALTRWTFAGKVMSLLFNMLSRLEIAFLPLSKRLLISWLQSPSAVILELKKIKICHCLCCFPFVCHEVMRPDAMIFILWMLSFKPAFSPSSFTFIKRLFSSSSFSAFRLVSSAYLRLLVFLLSVLILACASSSLALLMMYSA